MSGVAGAGLPVPLRGVRTAGAGGDGLRHACLASTTSSLPEVVGDAGLLVDPLDVDAIAAGLRPSRPTCDLRRELRRARARASRGLHLGARRPRDAGRAPGGCPRHGRRLRSVNVRIAPVVEFDAWSASWSSSWQTSATSSRPRRRSARLRLAHPSAHIGGAGHARRARRSSRAPTSWTRSSRSTRWPSTARSAPGRRCRWRSRWRGGCARVAGTRWCCSTT